MSSTRVARSERRSQLETLTERAIESLPPIALEDLLPRGAVLVSSTFPCEVAQKSPHSSIEWLPHDWYGGTLAIDVLWAR